MSLTPNVELVVEEKDLARFAFVESPAPADDDLGPNEILVRIEKFGFSANNITYAVLGRGLRYFEFFPAEEPGKGKVPVWGMGTVERSRHPDLAVGTRMYGYFPLARYVTFAVAQMSLAGFDVDRGSLPAVYNQYSVVGSDPFHLPDREDHMLLFRPLVFTSFFLDDYLAEGERYFGADGVLISSASSKTSFGLAFMLQRRRDAGGCEVLGLTSAKNVPFVEGLGLYDRVLTYDALATLPRERPLVFVDVAGSVETLAAVHRRLGPSLKASIMVGMSHWEESQPVGFDRDGGLRSDQAHTHTFFAPARVAERQRDWGLMEMVRRVSDGWQQFMAQADRWCRIEYGAGREPVAATYRAMLEGRAAPDQGAVLSLWEGAFRRTA